MSDTGAPRPPNVDPALLDAVGRVLRRDGRGVAPLDDYGESGHGGEAGGGESVAPTPEPDEASVPNTDAGREPYRYPPLPPQRYLVRERAAEERSEYYDGEVVAMAGGSTPHAAIAQNIGAHLYFRVRGGCTVFQADLKVQAAGANAFMYPDVFVLCGEPRYADHKHDVVTNPTVVFEVLSPGTERHDRTVKAAAYRRIPSLRAYVLVSQKEPRVEVYTRGEGAEWACAMYQHPEHVVRLDALGCELTVAEIYRNVLPAAVAAAGSTH